MLSSNMRGVALGPHIGVYEDESKKLDIDAISHGAVQFSPTTYDAPAFGFRESAFWVRLDVENPGHDVVPWFLELAYSHLDYVDLYVPRKDGGFDVRRTGDHLRFGQRDLEYRNFVFSLSEPPAQSRTYYLRLSTSGSMNIPLVAWSPIAFFDNQNREQPVLWMFYGLMLVMACYNAFIYVAVRERDYLYYCCYIVSYALFQFTLNGHTFQYFLPNHTWLANQVLPFCIGSAFLWSVQFMRAYLQLAVTLPTFDKWAKRGVWLAAFLSLCGLFGPYVWTIRGLVLTGTTLTGMMALTAAVLVRRGFRPAKLYLLAWGAFMAGIVLYFSKTLGILPNHFVTTWSIQIGASLEVILLSLALADRINTMRDHLADLNSQLSRNVHDLREALTKAEEATRVKSDFLATVSHELRTPLNAIINIPQGLMRDFPETDAAACSKCSSLFQLEAEDSVTPETACPECGAVGTLAREHVRRYTGRPEHSAQHLGIIERSGRHLLHVVNGILDFSRLDAGRLELRMSKVNLRSWLTEAVEPFEELAKKKGVRLVLEPVTSDAEMTCDPLRLSQVLINLIGNAIKFSEGRGVVGVGARIEGENVIFHVRDQGIGVAPEHHEKIFRSFEQVDQSDTRKFGGTGLGLSISRTLVRMHGGDIWIDSEVGVGSTFYFRVPLAGTVIEAEPADRDDLSLRPQSFPSEPRSLIERSERPKQKAPQESPA